MGQLGPCLTIHYGKQRHGGIDRATGRRRILGSGISTQQQPMVPADDGSNLFERHGLPAGALHKVGRKRLGELLLLLRDNVRGRHLLGPLRSRSGLRHQAVRQGLRPVAAHPGPLVHV